jgi:hypothetical protein
MTFGADPKKRTGRRGLVGATAESNFGGVSIPSVAGVRSQDPKLTAERIAPALKVLDQTTRPLHAVAGGTRAAIKGQNVPKAALRGLQNKDKTTFSDVLKDIGAPKWLASTAGFVLDVGLDPTTYLTGGTGSVLRQAAQKAGRDAAEKALAKGLTKEQADRYAARAFAQALKRGEDSRGVTVRFAGKEVPGVRKGTAKVGRGVKRVTPKPAKRAGGAVRHAAADFNPNIVPDNLSRKTYAEIRQATRTTRSSTSRGVYKTRQRAEAVRKEIGKKNYAKVIDAIEAGKIGTLPAELQKPARFLRDQFKYTRRLERRAGVKGASRRNYVPHVRAELVAEGKGMGARSVGARTIRPSSSKARKDQRTLAEIRETDPGKYVEDLPTVFASRMQEGVLAVNRATLNRRLADMGKTVRPGQDVSLKAGEAIYHVRGSDIRKLDAKEAARFADGQAPKNGRYVALNEQAVDRALKTVTPSGERSTSGRAVDQAQGAWKFLATQPNPGFHVRNFAGDSMNAFLAESAPRLAVNMKQSAGALRVLGRQEESLRKIGKAVDPSGKGLKIKGQRVSYEQLIKEAEDVGAIRSGFVSRELSDLMDASTKKGQPVKTSNRAERGRRWLNNREDVVRLATYIGGRKRGLSPEQAAARSSKYHFDYADLTELERKVLRRVMPFYTFSARNIPLQFQSVLTRPGKYAQYQKVREELAKAFGYEDNWERDLPEREQRSVPLPVTINGRKLTISLGPSGLPLTDLNEFPTTRNPIKQADEWLNRAMSMVTPGIKTPVELWANMSFFFRDQIERDEGPLVPISTTVAKGAQAAGVADKLGIVSDYVDKRTGKKGFAAPAKLVYALNVLPGPASFLNRVTTASDRPGQSPTDRTVAYLGLRSIPVDPASTKIERLYEARSKLEKQRAALNQRGVYADSPNPEYNRVKTQIDDLTGEIMKLRMKRGDKILPGRKKTSGGFSWPDKGGGFSWPDK